MEGIKAIGLSRNTIVRGEQELEDFQRKEFKGVRQPGGGRKKAIDIDPKIKDDLSRLIEPLTRGDPESPLKWTCKSLRKLSSELKAMERESGFGKLNFKSSLMRLEWIFQYATFHHVQANGIK